MRKNKVSEQVVKKLFFLHQTFIFHENEEVCACANMLIKSQRLDDKNISWIIANWEKSDHLINRLLRYPDNHPLITQWAKEVYQSGKLEDRKSEIIGILIDEDIPPFIQEDNDLMVWAVYYSKTSDEIKQKLLMEKFTTESAESLWEVAIRLQFLDVIEFMQKKVREK